MDFFSVDVNDVGIFFFWILKLEGVVYRFLEEKDVLMVNINKKKIHEKKLFFFRINILGTSGMYHSVH